MVTALPAVVSAQVLSVPVTSSADSGPGSFRDAVAAANTDAAIGAIVFTPGLTVSLETAVVYTGLQDLFIDGNGSLLSGLTNDATADTAPDSGIFVATTGAGLAIQDLVVADSFNNGIAVLVPSTANGNVNDVLERVTIERSKFHGVFVDAQESPVIMADGVLYPACADPHPSESSASISLRVVGSTLTANGTLRGGFDASVATGCPADFDGVHVDEGASGSIMGTLLGSTFSNNQSDGVDLDEARSGGIDLVVSSSNFTSNLGNGLGLTEVDAGNADVVIAGSTAVGNGGDGIAVMEADSGRVTADVRTSDTSGNGMNGTSINEFGSGALSATVVDSTLNGNTDAGLQVTQESPGRGDLTLTNVDLTGNVGGETVLVGVDSVTIN